MTLRQTRKLPTARHNPIHFLVSRHPELLIIICSLGVSIAASDLMLTRDPNSLLYYDDAVSHLVIARRVIDSITPGLAQFGSVWLPMTHIMLLPLVANNFLFQTGLAGTVVSGLSMAVAAMFLFRIVKLHFGSNYAGFLASSLFLMNTSVIYMSLVPMMEAPFMMFFMMASYYSLKWYNLHNRGNDLWLQYRSLLKCGMAITAATLTRYEAWFFPLGFILMILIVLLLTKRELWKRKIEAFLFIAGPYSVIGIGLWTVYNAIIFRNPFLFFTGPYSAQAQAITRPYRQHLYLQPGNAISTIFSVATDMYGLHVVILSLLGTVIFLYMKRKKSLLFSFLTITMLAFPIILDLGAMIQGSGEIYRHIVTGWFNGRYLIFAAPLFAFSCTSLVVFAATKGKKILTVGLTFLVLLFYGTSIVLHPLELGATTALSDGKLMPYRGDIPYAIDLGKALKRLYTGGHIVDFTLSKSSPIIQLYSGIQLKDFIDVNSKDFWQDSKAEPWTHVDYLILQKPIDYSNGVHINQSEYYDPIRDYIIYWNKNPGRLTSPWQPVGDSLLSSISIIYQNHNFLALKNERKNVVLEKIFDGLKFSPNIAIVGKNDILVAEKKTGQVHRIVNGSMLSQPLLDVNVATKGERGMMGIAVAKNETSGSTYVFLFYTQAIAEDGDDISGYRQPVGDRLYKYELVDNKLVNPKLLLSLPASPADIQNSGKVIIGPDDNVYLLVNDVNTLTGSAAQNEAQNTNIIIKPQDGQIKIITKPQGVIKPLDKTSKILRVTQDGKIKEVAVNTSINKTESEKKYYTYGIKNAFGMDFDPITQDVWYAGNKDYPEQPSLFKVDNSSHADVNGIDARKYSSPEFTWKKNAEPTAIKFLNSGKLGKEYENDLFVGDMNNGNLYHFDLNKNRTALLLDGSLSDKVVNSDKKIKSQILLTGLGRIADIEVGPDGYLYLSTISKPPQEEEVSPSPDGSIYRLRAVGK